MDRSTAYDFVLTFYSNQGPVLYRFQDKRQFQSKIAKVSHPMYFVPPLKGFLLELGIPTWGQKTSDGLPGRTSSWTIPSAMWIQSTNVTDGQTPDDSKDRAYA